MATAIIGTLKHLPKASILPTLPETGRPSRVYFIPNEDPTEDNRYNEYLRVKDETYPDGHWELVGPTTIDLTDYATKEEVSDLKDSIGEQIKNHIWQYIGYTPQRDNDEVDAYLLTYIYDKITQVFYKHKDNKE